MLVDSSARVSTRTLRPRIVRLIIGIDLNGNWGYEYRPSRLVCTDSYSGQYAFEAHETRAISDYLVNGTNEGEERDREVKAFIDLHSYGQLC